MIRAMATIAGGSELRRLRQLDEAGLQQLEQAEQLLLTQASRRVLDSLVAWASSGLTKMPPQCAVVRKVESDPSRRDHSGRLIRPEADGR